MTRVNPSVVSVLSHSGGPRSAAPIGLERAADEAGAGHSRARRVLLRAIRNRAFGLQNGV